MGLTLSDNRCPVCGQQRDATALTWIALLGPAGCEEDICLRRCPECQTTYLDVLEDGPAHLGPETWFVGPLHPLLTQMVIKRIADCAERNRSNCRCPSHLFIRNVLHPDVIASHSGRTPWTTEEAVRAALASMWSPLLERVLALARRVHCGQVRGDGTPFLYEHLFPVTQAVAAYTRGRLERAEAELAAAVALLHDVPAAWAWAVPALGGRDAALAEIEAAAGSRAAHLAGLIARPHSSQRLPGWQERYIATVRAEPIARMVVVLHRLNDLRCVHKNPRRLVALAAETGALYLPLAAETDPSLHREMETVLARLRERIRRDHAPIEMADESLW